jgi:hypothetical protein
MSYTEAVTLHGSQRKAALALGIKETTFRRLLGKEKEGLAETPETLARAGHAPGHFDQGVAPGYLMGKVTVQRDRDGEIMQTWERQSPDDEARQIQLMAAIEAMCATIPRIQPIDAPTTVLAKLLTLYNFFDYHVGMLAWHKEGGADWDLAIAEATGIQAMQSLVNSAPASKVGVVNIGGDFLHFDGLLPVTPTSGHVLDADSRFGKVVDTAIRLIRHLVALALQKHERVVLLIMEGNHDLSSSLWLRKLFGALFENEPRVEVHQNELPYYAMEWGVNMLGFHHGHMKKNTELPGLFAAMFRVMWGRCRKVYIHVGHRHHKEQKDLNGARVIQWPTLAAMDAHSARHGYFTDRELTALTYHWDFGEVANHTVTPELLGS